MGMMRGTTAAAVAAAVFSVTAAAHPPVPAAAADAEGPVVIRYDEDVLKAEPGPHAGGGQTTAKRYFDDFPDPKLIFRRRALHPGGAIGVHKLRHDEVYYVLAGRGELTVDALVIEVVEGAAIYLREGAAVGIRTLGDADLEIIIAYPPFE
jgi:quercetin dioxygenase-like cupin family protein